MSMVLANLELKGEKLYYTMRKPFDMLAKLPANDKWCSVVDALRTDYYQDVIAMSSAIHIIKQNILAA